MRHETRRHDGLDEGQAASGLEDGAEGRAGKPGVREAGGVRGGGAARAYGVSIGGGSVLGLPADAVRQGEGVAARAGPVPRAGAGAWPGVLGAARSETTALAHEYLQGVAERPGRAEAEGRLADSVGEAGSAAAQRGADGARGAGQRP